MISLSSSWAFLWNSLSHPVEEGQGESSWVCAWHQLSIFFLSQPFICYFLAVTEFNITKTWASGWFYPHDCGSAFLWIFHSCCLSCTGVSSCRHDGNVIKAESPGKRAGGFYDSLPADFYHPLMISWAPAECGRFGLCDLQIPAIFKMRLLSCLKTEKIVPKYKGHLYFW